MDVKPLPVTISALIDGNKILLIRRNKPPFEGLWGMPGGKIETGENIIEACIREIEEETGIRCDFRSIMGVVSEYVLENENVTHHFIIFPCILKPETSEITAKENEPKWFELDSLDSNRGIIIPSDFEMIKRMILKKENKHFTSVIEKQGDEYKLKKFE